MCMKMHPLYEHACTMSTRRAAYKRPAAAAVPILAITIKDTLFSGEERRGGGGGKGEQ